LQIDILHQTSGLTFIHLQCPPLIVEVAKYMFAMTASQDKQRRELPLLQTILLSLCLRHYTISAGVYSWEDKNDNSENNTPIASLNASVTT
jgi:hypothetical protein